MYVEKKVYGFTMDSVSRRPVVLLKGTDGEATVPLWISVGDGVSIAADLICRNVARQGKDDLLNSLLRNLGMNFSRITLDRESRGEVNAAVWLAGQDREQKVDIGLPEALNLALTQTAPLLVSTEIVEWATRYGNLDEETISESNERRFADFLEHLDIAQLNKLPM